MMVPPVQRASRSVQGSESGRGSGMGAQARPVRKGERHSQPGSWRAGWDRTGDGDRQPAAPSVAAQLKEGSCGKV